jgi:acyl-CoA synthetase (AMP-forming)/AMP-acid ligase II
MSDARAQQASSTTVSLGAAFAAACAIRHDRDFLVDDHMRLAGVPADLTSRRLAAVLYARGLRTGARIVFICRPSVAHTVAWFAAIRLGGVATNLHLLEPPEHLAETIAWLAADHVVHDEEFKDTAHRLAANAPQLNIVGLSHLLEEASSADASGLHLDNAASVDPVAIVLSSGSTGRPKGVVHTHASVLASIAAGVALYRGIGSGDSVLVCIGTSFGGWCNVVLPFVGAAAKLAFQRRFDPQAFLAGLAAEKITIAPLVPTMWRMVLAQQTQRYDLSSVRLAFMSGEAAGRRDVESVRARIAPHVRAAYLSTEGACASGVVADERDYLGDGPIAAHLLDSVEVGIIAADGRAGDKLPTEQVGEILLRSPSLAQGYWKDPQRTSDRFVDGWWRSGDTGFMTADGRLVVAGRTDHVINSGGVKVQAEEIEAALLAHPRIRQAAVVGLPDVTWGQRAEAFVLSDVDAEAITAWSRTEGFVPSLRFLKAIHVVDALPTGPTGKVYRPALRAKRD